MTSLLNFLSLFVLNWLSSFFFFLNLLQYIFFELFLLFLWSVHSQIIWIFPLFIHPTTFKLTNNSFISTWLIFEFINSILIFFQFSFERLSFPWYFFALPLQSFFEFLLILAKFLNLFFQIFFISNFLIKLRLQFFIFGGLNVFNSRIIQTGSLIFVVIDIANSAVLDRLNRSWPWSVKLLLSTSLFLMFLSKRSFSSFSHLYLL